VKEGRRKTVLQFNTLGLIGTVLTLQLDFNLICLGRFILGASIGVLLCATSKLMDETIPAKLIDRGFGTSTNILINMAVFGLLVLAIGMPSDSSKLNDTKYWMLLYGSQAPF